MWSQNVTSWKTSAAAELFSGPLKWIISDPILPCLQGQTAQAVVQQTGIKKTVAAVCGYESR